MNNAKLSGHFSLYFYLQLGDIERAKAMYDSMVADSPDNKMAQRNAKLLQDKLHYNKVGGHSLLVPRGHKN